MRRYFYFHPFYHQQDTVILSLLISILVILEVASALATLLGPSVCLAPLGPLQAAFKSAPGRFVIYPNHLLE